MARTTPTDCRALAGGGAQEACRDRNAAAAFRSPSGGSDCALWVWINEPPPLRLPTLGPDRRAKGRDSGRWAPLPIPFAGATVESEFEEFLGGKLTPLEFK